MVKTVSALCTARENINASVRIFQRQQYWSNGSRTMEP